MQYFTWWVSISSFGTKEESVGGGGVGAGEDGQTVGARSVDLDSAIARARYSEMAEELVFVFEEGFALQALSH